MKEVSVDAVLKDKFKIINLINKRVFVCFISSPGQFTPP